MSFLRISCLAAVLACRLLVPNLRAVELGTASTNAVPLTNAWGEAELAIKKFRLPPGFKMDVFAVEPQLANPVSFCLDEKGRVYVAETHRYRTSVYDIREFMSWYEEDLACATLADRSAMIKRHLGADFGKLEVESESIRLLEDTDGDGRADRSQVFATGFNSALDGIASGILARKGNIYFANIPEVTLLRDTNGDGKADTRKSISRGYGVRFSLTGHDLHGLKIGPDGRLYFSIGDRGSHVQSMEGKTFAYPNEGAVYRCNLDGTELEVFATGVRNPQELAFDEFGNLFTGDNNCDHGDKARLVYLVKGGDSGWRIGFQFSETNPAGVWNAEKLWQLRWPGQAAYILPPVAHIADGPSGLAYNPGTGLPKQYAGNFFLCDFRGQAAGSGIHNFTVKPSGASFTMDTSGHFLWDILLTDCEFGPDGKLYVSDWVHGWPKSERGRIYRVYNPEEAKLPIVGETRQLIANGMDRRADSELAKLLAHPDMRVRQEAQFSLVTHRATTLLVDTALNGKDRLARLHGIWGLGQLGRKNPPTLEKGLVLLGDNDAEVRAQAAKVFGEAKIAKAAPGLIQLLADTNPRVRMFAALALAELGAPSAFKPVVEMLRQNDDKDVYLRHAGVMALAASKDRSGLVELSKDTSPAVRIAASLVLRRQKRPEVARFLEDSDPLVALEAARAINDLPIVDAIPQLAALIEKRPHLSIDKANPAAAELQTAYQRRVINANFRQGSEANAKALAAFAASAEAPEAVRAECLRMLAQWGAPSSRDKVTGLWKPLPTRNAQAGAEALKPLAEALVQKAPASVQIAAVKAIGQLGLSGLAPALLETLSSAAPNNVKSESLRALVELKSDLARKAIELAQASPEESLRKEATRLQAQTKPGEATARLIQVLDTGGISERQGALAALANVEGSVADETILRWLKRADAPKELELDILEAALQRQDQRIVKKLAELKEAAPEGQFPGEWRAVLYGGDAEQGKKIFLERPEAACVRCHKIKGEGGDVGPDLSQAGTKYPREYLLESVLFPNKKIAPGFESVLVKLKSGAVSAGVLKSETADLLEINSPEDGLIKVKKSEIVSREKGLSGMPEGLGTVLSKQDLRNLMEFLGSQK